MNVAPELPDTSDGVDADADTAEVAGDRDGTDAPDTADAPGDVGPDAACEAEGACDDGDPCTVDTCEPDTGGCVHTPLDCDDGESCTLDLCDDGVCRHVCKSHCLVCPCQDDADCEDRDLCTVDACNQDRGSCTFEEGKCDDGDPCTLDHCDSATGDCTHEPMECPGDGDDCTVEYCEDGTCKYACDSSDDTCDCVACQDDADCTESPTCMVDACDQAQGVCAYWLDDCDDGDFCTIDFCEEDVCHHVWDMFSGCDPPCVTDADCQDGDLCTDSHCDVDLGICKHQEANCDDGDACTLDGCEPSTGACFHEAIPDCP